MSRCEFMMKALGEKEIVREIKLGEKARDEC